MKFGMFQDLADSSHAELVAAIRLFNKYQNSRNEPSFESMAVDYVEDDNLRAHLARYGQWIGTTSIPYAHQKTDIHTWGQSSSDVRYLRASTKIEYADKLKEALKEKFPNHTDWIGHTGDEHSWWSAMRAGLTKLAD